MWSLFSTLFPVTAGALFAFVHLCVQHWLSFFISLLFLSFPKSAICLELRRCALPAYTCRPTRKHTANCRYWSRAWHNNKLVPRNKEQNRQCVCMCVCLCIDLAKHAHLFSCGLKSVCCCRCTHNSDKSTESVNEFPTALLSPSYHIHKRLSV